MKRDKKALYEKIMKSISKEVKKSLNEIQLGLGDDFEKRYKTQIYAARAIRKILKRENVDDVIIDEKNSLIDDYLYMHRLYISSETNEITIYVSEDWYPGDPEDISDFVYTYKELDGAGIDPNMVYLALRNQLGGDYSDIEEPYHPWIG